MLDGTDFPAPFPGYPGDQEFQRRYAEQAPRETPSWPPGIPTAPVFYLDQKVWVSLLRAQAKDSGDHVRLRDAVDTGQIVVALSVANYVETWHRGEWKSRWALARLMWDISHLVALPPLHAVLHGEVADAMRRFDAPVPPGLEGDVLLGHGVNFAYGRETGRLTHVDDEGQEVPWAHVPRLWRDAHASSPTWYEWFSLAGMPFDMRADGVDLGNNRRAGIRLANREREWAQRLGARKGVSRERPLIIDALRGVQDEIADVCEAAGLDPRAFLLWLLEDEQARAAKFIEAMNAWGTYSRLRILRHANPQKQWEGNDRSDLMALSVALTSCEVVVTERLWCDLARRAGCVGGESSRVYHSLSDALDSL